VENEPAGFILPDNPGLTARALLGPLIADAPIGLALVDDKFCYVFINETQAGFNDLPVLEHTGKSVRQVLGDAAWEQLSPLFQRSLKGESLRSHEFTAASLRQPSVRRHYLASFYAVRADRRTVTGVGTVVTDITERKQSEALIAGQNKILEGIAMDVPLPQTLTALAELIEEQLPGVLSMVLWAQMGDDRLSVVAAPGLSCEVASEIWESLQPSLIRAGDDGDGWPRRSITTPLPRRATGDRSPEGVSDVSVTCWMVPVLGEKDQLIAALGILLPEDRTPTARETSLIDSAIPTARIAVERDRELVRRRQLLRDMLGSLTEGRLVLCLSEQDLPEALGDPFVESMALSKEVLRDLRRSVSTIAESLQMAEDRRYDLEVAVGEAAMNAVVHAGSGTGDVFADAALGRLQIWIRDSGTGIAEESLHRATLERGFSTSNTLGQGSG
jgi:PAS domain-containing protein